MEFNIEAFDPNKEQLQEIVSETKQITKESGEEKVKEYRTKIVRTRTTIQKIGKKWRDEANAFNKKVLAKEKELLEIITPEEERLKSIEAEIEKEKIMEERKASLPRRHEKLNSIGDNITVSDETLLEMNDLEFVEYRQQRIDNHEMEQERKINEEIDRAAREKEIEEAERRARKEGEERAAQAAALAKWEAEKREKEEKLKAEKNEKFQEWKKELGITEQDKIERDGYTFIAYKRVGKITID